LDDCKIITVFIKSLVFVLFQVLCEKGGVLFLARAILKLNVTPPFVESSRVVAAVSRLKAKFLSIVSPRDEKILLTSTPRLDLVWILLQLPVV
jgi:hypothetical protein